MAMGEMAVAVSVMPLAMRVMPVAMTVGAVRATVMPVGAWMDPVRVEVAPMSVPVVSVGVPALVEARPGRRRGVGVGHREEGDERAEREPRDRIAAPVPVVVSPARLGGAGDGDHGRENECCRSYRGQSTV